MPRRKNKHLIRIIVAAVAVIAVILTAAVAAIYLSSTNTQKTPSPKANPALQVGDTFTYKLTGSTVIGDVDTVAPAEFLQYNETDYYKVNITSIQGSQVSLETTWQFKNGTQVTSPQVIDLSTGACAELAGFSYLYPANLNVTDPLYPQETSKLFVNSTSTQQYAHSSRAANYWATEDEFVNSADQSGNTMRYDYISVYFDKQTGMLDQLTRIEFLTNPEIQFTTTWQLTSSNVWAVQ
jgi:hypothetical protein